MNFTNRSKLGLLGLTAMIAAPLAQAQVVVTDTVAEIEGAAAPIAAIAGAVLAILVGIKVWKWVRRAM